MQLNISISQESTHQYWGPLDKADEHYDSPSLESQHLPSTKEANQNQFNAIDSRLAEAV